VYSKLALSGPSQRVQEDLYPFPSGELECGNEVAISRHYHNRRDAAGQCQSGDVQADAQVNSLLRDVWNDVIRLQPSGLQIAGSLGSPVTQFPSTDTYFAEADGETRGEFKAANHRCVVAMHLSRAEVDHVPIERIGYSAARGQRMVEIGAEQTQVRDVRITVDLIDQPTNVPDCGEAPKVGRKHLDGEWAINQDRILVHVVRLGRLVPNVDVAGAASLGSMTVGTAVFLSAKTLTWNG